MANRDVLYEKEGNLAIITLNRPERLNSFAMGTMERMVDAVEDAGRDTKVRAIIVTGAGDRGFCTGADVNMLAANIEAGQRRYTAEHVARRDFALHIYDVEKPTFAAVNGAAVGAGFGLSLAFDFRIASEKARFSSMFVRRGVAPHAGVSWHLPRIVGYSKALELMLTGDLIDAQEALRIGLVSKVVPPEKLMEATKEMATRIVEGPVITQTLIKRQLRRSVLTNNLEIQIDFENYQHDLTLRTDEHKEGVRAFLEKREPQFKGG